jgi:crotonobetainyl-CoA:carnitine CoA-transferase CaiB-like acyl-CoA transferase
VRTNLGKKSLALDLKSARGRDLFLRLHPHVDIVAENLRSGAMERLGLGPDELLRLHPSLIYVSISGFGRQPGGPYADWPAYTSIAEAMAGFNEAARHPGERPPVGTAGALGDLGTALFGVIGVLAALLQREKDGKGRWLDLAMYDSMVALADMIPNLWSMGVATGGKIGAAVADSFKASDGYFVILVIREEEFARLAHAVGHPDWLEDDELATRSGWGANTGAVFRPAIEAWARDLTKLEAAERLCQAGVPAGPCHTADDVVADRHLRDRDMVLEVERPLGGPPILVAGNPVRLSGCPSERWPRRWPRLGQHSEAVLRDLLGLSHQELEQLRIDGVIGEADPPVSWVAAGAPMEARSDGTGDRRVVPFPSPSPAGGRSPGSSAGAGGRARRLSAGANQEFPDLGARWRP